MIRQVKFVGIPTKNQERALKFWTETMGLKVLTDQPLGNQRWIELQIPGAQTRIVLFTPEGHEDRIGSVYLHPRTLLLLVYDRQRGLRFVDVQERHASEVHDIDGIVRFTRLAPAGLRLDESEWRERKNEAAVVAAFKTRFAARVASVVPVFVPLWKAMIRRTQPEGMRVILLDAIAGHLVDWT